MNIQKYFTFLSLVVFLTTLARASEIIEEQYESHKVLWHELNEKYTPFIKGYHNDNVSKEDFDYHFKRSQSLREYSITEAMLEKAENNYQLSIENPNVLRILKRGSTLKEKFFDFDPSLTSLYKLKHIEKNKNSERQVEQDIAFLDVFNGYMGYCNLFVNQNLIKQLDQHIFRYGYSEAIRASEHISGLDYAIDYLLDETKLKHGCITHIYTDEWAKEKGYATLIIKLGVDLLFKTTDIHFLVTSISYHRVGSWKAFKKNGFTEMDDEKPQIDLQIEGLEPFKPVFYSGHGGNYYLSRKIWEQNLARYL